MISQQYKDCLSYIESYWDKIIVRDLENNKFNAHYIPVPYPYLKPNTKKFNYVFYWDTFFMFRGLLGTNRVEVMMDMIENFIHLFNQLGVIPNFNSQAATNRSQPPFFSTMIFDVFEITQDKDWLKTRMNYAKLEYMHVWHDRDNAYNHRVNGYYLSKYGDRDVGYSHSAELESGWDFTSRFYNRCGDFLPVDLNCYLYKYERDFMRVAEMFGDSKEKKYWETQSERRKRQIYKYCWNEKLGFFFDYDYVHKKRSNFYSLAGFVPLWAGIVEPDDAKRMLNVLAKFETKNGLFINAKESLAPAINIKSLPQEYRIAVEALLKPKQWDYPHIWPPIEYLTVVGLLRYGFIDHAVRIIKESLAAQAKVFRKYHTFSEKIDGVKGDRAGTFHYPNQLGFGWTNAVFYRYIKLIETIESVGPEALYKQPKADKPPYAFLVAH